jgi:hypothetical protein
MSNTSGNVPRFYSELPDYLPDGRPAMTTFDSAITRAETDLAHVQSALDTAQQALEVADRAHSVGRRLVRMIRFVVIAFAIGAVLVGVAVLFDRLWRGFRREQGDETTEVTGSVPLLTGSDAVVEHYPAEGSSSPAKEGRTTGLDGRHRNEDGRIEKKRGDTKIGNLKAQYPELKDFPDDATLGELRDRYHVDSLDALLRELRAK